MGKIVEGSTLNIGVGIKDKGAQKGLKEYQAEIGRTGTLAKQVSKEISDAAGTAAEAAQKAAVDSDKAMKTAVAAAKSLAREQAAAWRKSISELDQMLKAGLVSREEYTGKMIELADREGVSQRQALQAYGKAKQVHDQILRDSARIAEQHEQRVSQAAAKEVQASKQIAAEAVATERKVGAAYDAESKKISEHYDKVIAAYKKAVAETGKGEPGAGSGKAKGGTGSTGGIGASDILNATLISAAFAEIKEQVSAGIEQVSKFDDAVNESDAVFDQYSGHIKDWAKTTTQSMGLSETAAISAAAKIGNVITDVGLTGETAAAMSPKLIQLAADLGSFEHVGTDKALNAITMGMEGNVKGLKNLGIVITPAMMKTEALKQGLISSTKDALDPATKAQVLYALMLRQGEKASGDFAKRQGDVRNEQQKLTAELEDAQKKLGQDVTPAYAGFLKVLDNIFLSFKNGPTDIETFAGSVLGIVGTGGALTLMLGKLIAIGKAMGGLGMLTPGGFSAGAGFAAPASFSEGLASLAAPTAGGLLGGAVLALPAVVGGVGANMIVNENAITTKNAELESGRPKFQQTADRISDMKERNDAITKRLAEIKQQQATQDNSTSGLADAGARAARGVRAGVEADPSPYVADTVAASNAAADTNSNEVRQLQEELRINAHSIELLNKIEPKQRADFDAWAKNQNVKGHLPHDPKIGKQKQGPSDEDKDRAAAEARKGEEDAAEAEEMILRGQRENLQKNLLALQEQYKAGKGPDSLLDVLTKTAIHLRNAEQDEAKAVYERQIARDPKHIKAAQAQLTAANKTAGENLHRFRVDEVPKLHEERDRAIDTASMKLIDFRLKDYSKDDTDAQRAHVLADVDAMRKRLHTANAQEEARQKVTEARKKVEGEILESDEKYRQIIEENRKLFADLAQRRQQAGLDLLNAELSETRDLKARANLRGQIRDAQIVQAGNVHDAAYADIAEGEAATRRKQSGKLTPEQVDGFKTRRDIADQEQNNAGTQAGTAFTKGSEQDARDDHARQARELREAAEFAKTATEKADLILGAWVQERDSLLPDDKSLFRT